MMGEVVHVLLCWWCVWAVFAAGSRGVEVELVMVVAMYIVVHVFELRCGGHWYAWLWLSLVVLPGVVAAVVVVVVDNV